MYRDIATGKGLLEKVVENLVKADKIGNEMYLSFISDCLIKGKAGLFDTIKKVNLEIEITKKIWKVVSVMKEARQVSGLMLGGRSEPRRDALVPCYISAIKVSISRFNS